MFILNYMFMCILSVYMNLYIYVFYAHTLMCTYIYMYTYTYIQMKHFLRCIYKYINIYVYTDVHTCTDIHAGMLCI